MFCATRAPLTWRSGSMPRGGLLELTSAIGIIYGANLGTTTGAWLVAGFGLKVNLSTYAMPMLVFGIILMLQKSKSLKGSGYVPAGLGFLLRISPLTGPSHPNFGARPNFDRPADSFIREYSRKGPSPALHTPKPSFPSRAPACLRGGGLRCW